MGTPADVVKTRVMNQPRDSNGWFVFMYFCWWIVKNIIFDFVIITYLYNFVAGVSSTSLLLTVWFSQWEKKDLFPSIKDFYQLGLEWYYDLNITWVYSSFIVLCCHSNYMFVPRLPGLWHSGLHLSKWDEQWASAHFDDFKSWT